MHVLCFDDEYTIQDYQSNYLIYFHQYDLLLVNYWDLE